VPIDRYFDRVRSDRHHRGREFSKLAPVRDHDRGVASKLAYHLTLLEPSIRSATNVREPAELLAAVTVAERIHNEIDRLCVIACTKLGATLDQTGKVALHEAARALDAALEERISGNEGIDEQTELFTRIENLRRVEASAPQREALAVLAAHFENIAALLSAHSDELPRVSAESAEPLPKPAFHLSKFLVRFCARHTIAMTIAFVSGLFDNNAALHAALWLLMIGGRRATVERRRNSPCARSERLARCF
jgi:hypothetical protein